MGPKKGGGGVKGKQPLSSKDKTKIVEDRTFGLKNKNKSKKVQKYVSQVRTQVEQKGGGKQRGPSEAELRREKKKEDAAYKAEVQRLFNPVVVQTKVPLGVDPKSVLCEFFKAGLCAKGSKCKFSHDVNIGQKVEHRDIYTDMRDHPDSKENDTMDKWDQEKLTEVVGKKARENENRRTEIVCKYFLRAVEDCKYGWFWECPNGKNCMYRHALPPEFVLKRKTEVEMPEESGPSLEEVLEEERKKIKGGTPVTEESFAAWKAARLERAEKKAADEARDKERAFRAGKLGNLSGRDLFQYDPEMFVDDEEALGGAELLTREEGYEDEEDEEPDLGDEGEQEARGVPEPAAAEVVVEGVELRMREVSVDDSAPLPDAEVSAAASGPINEELFLADAGDLPPEDDDE